MPKKFNEDWRKNIERARRQLFSSTGSPEPIAKRALADAEAHDDEESIADALAILASYYVSAQRPEADAFSRRALDMTEKVYGAMSWEYCDRLLCRAIFLDTQSDFGGALALRESAISIAEVSNEVEGVLDILDLLVFYFIEIGRYRQAESYFERALTKRKNIFGEDSAEYNLQLPIYLTILRGQGDFAAAEKLLQRCGPGARYLDDLFKKMLTPPKFVDLNARADGKAIGEKTMGVLPPAHQKGVRTH